MQKIEVCVIDSGVGGICVLAECVRALPNVDFLYIADNANSPYGNKEKPELDKQLECLIYKINKSRGIVFFVLACNTATAMSIEYLRMKFPYLTFIGIEPAIKPSLKNGYKTLVLSTMGTFKYSKLIRKHLSDKNIFFAPQVNLASMIDQNLGDLWNIYDYLINEFEKYRLFGIKNIVLGCTHYYFIKTQLAKIFPNAVFFESSQGVANHLNNLATPYVPVNEKSGKVEFLTTFKDLKFENKLIDIFNAL